VDCISSVMLTSLFKVKLGSRIPLPSELNMGLETNGAVLWSLVLLWLRLSFKLSGFFVFEENHV